MDTIITYAEKELRTWREEPFHEVDSLILSWLSYIRWPIPEGECRAMSITEMFRAECFGDMFANIADQESTRQLLTAVVASPRYRRMKLWHYVSQTDAEQEKQFAAVTFVLDDGICYVAYRGTDATFVGWKEDLNMAFQYPVPSQESAAAYLRNLCETTKGQILIGGHSKGGNLAVYAAAHNALYADRILKIYSHDGPGFLKEVIQSEEFKNIQDKVEKTVPQSSVVGLLLEQHGAYQVIRSNKKGLWQHNPFTWCVEEGRLCHLPELTVDAEIMDTTISGWLATISQEERERFVDTLYRLSEDVEADNFLEFGQALESNIPKVWEAMAGMDKETRAFMLSIIKRLVTFSVKNIPDGVKAALESLTPKKDDKTLIQKDEQVDKEGRINAFS